MRAAIPLLPHVAPELLFWAPPPAHLTEPASPQPFSLLRAFPPQVVRGLELVLQELVLQEQVLPWPILLEPASPQQHDSSPVAAQPPCWPEQRRDSLPDSPLDGLPPAPSRLDGSPPLGFPQVPKPALLWALSWAGDKARPPLWPPLHHSRETRRASPWLRLPDAHYFSRQTAPDFCGPLAHAGPAPRPEDYAAVSHKLLAAA